MPVPDGVPAERAVLAGTVETAVNALWDAAPLVGDRVTVVGAGMVGCCVGRAAGPVPRRAISSWSTPIRRKEAVAKALGVAFAAPADAAAGRDLVVHASATGAGLQRSLELLAPEGTVLELSWYGDHSIQLALGGAFHSGRLTIRSSQVGTVAPAGPATYRGAVGAGPRPAARPPVRRPDHRRGRRSPSCRPYWPGWRPARCPRSATS